MRMSVAVLRNTDAGQRAKEKAETPTVKTEEQTKKEEELKAKYGTTAKDVIKKVPVSVWRRKFRPLPEDKAVDLFADVIGDAFILAVAGGLITYEYWRSSQKPDKNKEMIEDLHKRIDDLRIREEELETKERAQLERLQLIEDALRAFKDPKTKQPLLATPTAVS